MHLPAKRFIDQIALPFDDEAFSRWVGLDNAHAFLRWDLAEEHLVLYASIADVFMHTILVPHASLRDLEGEDLLGWNSGPHSSWGFCYTFGDSPKVWIEPPLQGCGSKVLSTGEQLVFGRTFDGYRGHSQPIELLQKLAHLFGLHYVEARSAYCRLDRLGDLEDVVTISEVDELSPEVQGGTIVTMNRAVLDEYMAVSESTAVRMFDITRFSHRRGFGGWSHNGESVEHKDRDLWYRVHVEPGHASYMRGVQIIPSQTSREEAARKNGFGDDPRRQYETFIAHDWKNRVLADISTAPGATANYFTKSSLPFEVSPAFFRPEVLLKYKTDSDKYTLKDRSISCRGAWHLQTYDVNEVGQVHTYIVYLRSLPYEEQLYWKSFNEAPKGPISKRALRSDFEGRFVDEYDALSSLRTKIRELNAKRAHWWIKRSDEIVDRVHYPVTTSPDEWASEVLNLEKTVVEGFSGSVLRAHAKALGRNPAPKLGSLKLIEECLVGLGFENDRAREVTAPFHQLHYLRSVVKAHDGGSAASTERKTILKQHGAFAKHFKTLCAECDKALATLTESFASLK